MAFFQRKKEDLSDHLSGGGQAGLLDAASSDEEEFDVAETIRRLEIVAKKQVQDLFAGEYQSAFKGRGMAFLEHRQYQPGDEVRWIDWKVSARMGETYVKQFMEERERTVMLLWDASSSMDLGTQGRSKREVSAEICMLLALSAVQNNDRIGLIIFGDDVEKFVVPKKGRNHVMRLIKDMLRYRSPSSSSGSERGLSLALQFMQQTAPRHTIGFVVSDFLYTLDTTNLRLLARKHDIVAVTVHDPLEVFLPHTDHSLLDETELELIDTSETTPSSLYQNAMWFSWLLAVVFALVGVLWGGMYLWVGVSSALLVAVMGTYLMNVGPGGVWTFEDLETGEVCSLDMSSTAFTRTYLESNRARREAFSDVCKQLQMEHIDVSTGEDVMPALLAFFHARRKRAHG
ncbi:MAG TPA: hypothetical protein DCE42_08680 [Myxococcales bacterium]|nr:hypothetical protein [Deltaproteobacteria bacterium]HAA54821.1 hypothetical protein [Myxococcales bacterium]|tara:strand:+ start:379 stop:1581 length:1203 start_codon:yes stop_codon:yes gene_type:complete